MICPLNESTFQKGLIANNAILKYNDRLYINIYYKRSFYVGIDSVVCGEVKSSSRGDPDKTKLVLPSTAAARVPLEG